MPSMPTISAKCCRTTRTSAGLGSADIHSEKLRADEARKAAEAEVAATAADLASATCIFCDSRLNVEHPGKCSVEHDVEWGDDTGNYCHYRKYGGSMPSSGTSKALYP